jgi:hypothetical protein
MEIKVLWIDDQPNNAFVDNADNEGIYIEVFENVDAGINELLNSGNSYDAIILDANCLCNDGTKEPEVSTLSYALKRITEEKIELPWFVYSGGGFSDEVAIDIIVKGHKRNYDNRNWYKKPIEMKELFGKIKEVAPNSANYVVKSKYPEIFSWYPNEKELLEILIAFESNKKNAPDVFNKIRKELDWVMNSLYDCGLLQEPYKGSNLTDCSKFLCDKNLRSLVPIHVQRSFHSTTCICNEGSHRLAIDDLVKSGKAPYLVQSTVSEFLNILYWLKDMPKTFEGIEDLKSCVKKCLTSGMPKPKKEEYEGKDYVIEKDEKGVFHCGQCRLTCRVDQQLVGQTATLYDVVDNSSKNKATYPFFAKYQLKE